MALGGCYGCIKYLMFAFNFLFWLLGCVILGVGIWIRVAPTLKKYTDEATDFQYLYTGAYVLIVIGVIIMVIGFLGCCGAIRESQCMLALFFVFLFIIFAVLLGAGIWAVVEKNKLKKMIDDTLMDKVKNYETNEDARKFMDNLQEEFKCCGAGKGQDDYTTYRPNMEAPDSCGKHTTTPCSEEFFNYLSQNMIIIAGIAIGIGVIMLLGMVFSMCLCCAIREEALA